MKKFLLSLVAVAMAFVANAGSRTTLWEGEQAMDASWPYIGFPATEVAHANVGDLIVVSVTVDNTLDPTWQWGPQVFIKADWTDWLPATNPSVNAGETEITFELTEAKLALVANANELEIQGMNVIVKKVELESPTPTVLVDLNLEEGNYVALNNFVDYDDSYVVVLNIENHSGASRNGWGVGAIGHVGDWNGPLAIKGGEGDAFSAMYTIGQLKEVAKVDGEYFTDEYNRQGITINVYNDCVATGMFVKVPDLGNAISNVNAEATSTISYNVMGQQTNAANGLMIRNGKLIMVK